MDHYVPTRAGLRIQFLGRRATFKEVLGLSLVLLSISAVYQDYFNPVSSGRLLIEPPRFFLSVVAIFKNEADVMKEWIDHHLEQGVDHFFLVNHNSSDNFSSILDLYGENRITVFNEERMHAQTTIMNELIHKIKSDTDWIMSIDLDEYMYVRQNPQSKQYGSTVSSALSVVTKQKNSPCQILVPWTMFGSSGHIEQPPSVRMNFTQCDPNPHQLSKFIVRSKMFHQYGVHKSNCDGYPWNRCLTGTHKCNSAEAVLALNHYPIMSLERFKRVKMTRGDVSDGYQHVRNEEYFQRNDDAFSKSNDCLEMSLIVQSAQGKNVSITET